jgi:hypothetical protein
MNPQALNVPPGGTATPQTAELTPEIIAAKGQSRDSLVRLIILGGLLGLLCLAYCAAMIWRPENARDVLLVISSLGAYLIGDLRQQPESDTSMPKARGGARSGRK